MRSRHLSYVAAVLVLGGMASAAGASTFSPPPPPESEDFELREVYEPSAGAIAGAIALNVVYAPLRFVITVVGAGLGGIEGFISAGDQKAAEKVWGLSDGSQVITPAMLEGRQQFTFGSSRW